MPDEVFAKTAEFSKPGALRCGRR